jgi:hypothetical protein
LVAMAAFFLPLRARAIVVSNDARERAMNGHCPGAALSRSRDRNVTVILTRASVSRG